MNRIIQNLLLQFQKFKIYLSPYYLTFHFMCCTILSEGCIVFITILFRAVTILWGIDSAVCHGMNNIPTTFMCLHFDCLQLCVYFLFIIISFVWICQMKADKKWLSLWHEMLSLVNACCRWKCAKRSRRFLIGCVTFDDWKMEGSESENWSSVELQMKG